MKLSNRVCCNSVVYVKLLTAASMQRELKYLPILEFPCNIFEDSTRHLDTQINLSDRDWLIVAMISEEVLQA